VEWVETTGKTVEEAKDRALDLLGVDERDAEFEVIEEPKVGFLGRVKGTARVRGRVRPAAPRVKAERRDRRKRGDGAAPRNSRGRRPAPGGADGGDADGREPAEAVSADAGDRVIVPEREGSASAPQRRRNRNRGGSGRGPEGASRAASGGADDDVPTEEKVSAMPELSLDDQARIVSEFLDGLVAAFGFSASTSWEHTDEDNTEVRVEGDNLGLLVGPKGRTLQAVTEVARSVVVRHGEGGSSGRVHVDIAGYRQRRREALARFTAEVAEQVRSTGTPKALEPMSAADRKVVHDTVNGLDGVGSTSEGEDPYRRVVIIPA
jgi:spoIIIJ-associated protein